eukprot:95329-Pleurochrysis_carterae.AAC.1
MHDRASDSSSAADSEPTHYVTVGPRHSSFDAPVLNQLGEEAPVAPSRCRTPPRILEPANRQWPTI